MYSDSVNAAVRAYFEAVVVAGTEEDILAVGDDGHVVRALGVVVETPVDGSGHDALESLFAGVRREAVEVPLHLLGVLAGRRVAGSRRARSAAARDE